MSRIETPQWVISVKKKHSYISNARNHCRNYNVKTMDISQFYDSAKRKYVYSIFKEKFLMEDDIAWIMRDLVMCGGPSLPFRSGGLAAAVSRKGMESVLDP